MHQHFWSFVGSKFGAVIAWLTDGGFSDVMASLSSPDFVFLKLTHQLHDTEIDSSFSLLWDTIIT